MSRNEGESRDCARVGPGVAVDWWGISGQVFLAIVGAILMGLVLHGGPLIRSLSEDAADWAGAGATVLTGFGAVAGAYWLWREQQRKRSEQLLTAGVAMFLGVYHRLLELQVFTNFSTWRKFYKDVHGKYPTGSAPQIWALHKAAGERYMVALYAEIEFTIESFSGLRDNLGDIEAERLDPVLKLFTFVGGMPLQLGGLYREWAAQDVTTAEASLPPAARQLLDYGVGAMAFHLHRFDGVVRSKARADRFAAFNRAQKQIHLASGG